EHAVLYAHFLQVKDIQHAIQEIEIAEIARAKYPQDKIVNREFTTIIELQKSLLNHFLYEGFYNPDAVKWYYRVQRQEFSSSSELNIFLTDVVNEVYPSTPIFISELANKSKLTPAISTARRILIESLIENKDQEHLGIQ